MNNRLVAALVGVAALAAYFFYSRTSTSESYSQTGVSASDYNYAPLPPAPVGDAPKTVNYNVSFPDVPAPQVSNVAPALPATSQGGGGFGGSAPKGNVPAKYDVPGFDAAAAAAADPYKGVFKPVNKLSAGIANAPAAQPIVGGYMGGPSAHMVDGKLYAPGLKTVQKPSIFRSPFQGG